jgi:hypothetical protein
MLVLVVGEQRRKTVGVLLCWNSMVEGSSEAPIWCRHQQ